MVAGLNMTVESLPDLRDGPGAGLQSLRQPDKAG